MASEGALAGSIKHEVQLLLHDVCSASDVPMQGLFLLSSLVQLGLWKLLRLPREAPSLPVGSPVHDTIMLECTFLFC